MRTSAGRSNLAPFAFLFALVAGSSLAVYPVRGDELPKFVRGLNLNGPPLWIDGHAWEGSDAAWYRCDDKAFENQNVTLTPATDGERARMIRSSRFGGNRVELTDLQPGVHTLFLYVWEDNNSEVYTVLVNDREVLANWLGGAMGAFRSMVHIANRWQDCDRKSWRCGKLLGSRTLERGIRRTG